MFDLGTFEVLEPREVFNLIARYRGVLGQVYKGYLTEQEPLIASEYVIEGEGTENHNFVRCIEKPLNTGRYYDIHYSVPLVQLPPGSYKLSLYEYANTEVKRQIENVAIELRLQ